MKNINKKNKMNIKTKLCTIITRNENTFLNNIENNVSQFEFLVFHDLFICKNERI